MYEISCSNLEASGSCRLLLSTAGGSWQGSDYFQDQFSFFPHRELREKIQPEIMELIKQQRLNRLCEGTCFRKISSRRRQGESRSNFMNTQASKLECNNKSEYTGSLKSNHPLRFVWEGNSLTLPVSASLHSAPKVFFWLFLLHEETLWGCCLYHRRSLKLWMVMDHIFLSSPALQAETQRNTACFTWTQRNEFQSCRLSLKI